MFQLSTIIKHSVNQSTLFYKNLSTGLTKEYKFDFYNSYYDKDIYCDTCDIGNNVDYYNEIHDNYNEKLYGDYDDWEDYIDSIYN